MSLAKYLVYKGIVKEPKASDIPHKGKSKSDENGICDYVFNSNGNKLPLSRSISVVDPSSSKKSY